jgi:hypothetical protein
MKWLTTGQKWPPSPGIRKMNEEQKALKETMFCIEAIDFN